MKVNTDSAIKPNSSPLPFQYNQFGYNIGGPFYIPDKFNKDKSKFFWYFGQEWVRYRTSPVNAAPAAPADSTLPRVDSTDSSNQARLRPGRGPPGRPRRSAFGYRAPPTGTTRRDRISSIVDDAVTPASSAAGCTTTRCPRAGSATSFTSSGVT